jgi:putative FmdB family regulatory protein
VRGRNASGYSPHPGPLPEGEVDPNPEPRSPMPTYDYVCDACKHEFELFQSIKDEPKKKCPECGKRKLRRLIGPGAAIVFRGSGFYTTDYRSESYKKAAAAEKSDGKPADAKKDKPAETAKKKHKAKD